MRHPDFGSKPDEIVHCTPLWSHESYDFNCALLQSLRNMRLGWAFTLEGEVIYVIKAPESAMKFKDHKEELAMISIYCRGFEDCYDMRLS